MLITRLTGPAIGAAIITTGLGLLMVKLIHVDFEAEPENEPIAMFAQIDEEETKPIRIRRVQPKTYRKVDVPPRIIPIDTDAAIKPTEAPFDASKVTKIEFKRPKLDIRVADTGTIDKDAQPIQRVVAKVPDRALRDGRSGHCVMQFNVDTRGKPYDVVASHCSHTMFKESAIKATKKFKYLAKIRDGVPVDMTGVETRITYQVKDERGRILPES